MNYGELVTAVRMNVDDEHGDFLSDNIVLNVLSRAFTHINRKLLNIGLISDHKTLTATFTSDTREVGIGGVLLSTGVLLERIQKVIAVQYSPSGIDIPIMTREDALKSAVPAVYIRREVSGTSTSESINNGTYLGFHVIPTTDFSVTVEYVKLTEELIRIHPPSDHTLFILGPEYHDIVILYATLLALAKDEDKVGIWSSLYQEALADVMEISDGSREVVDVYDGVWE